MTFPDFFLILDTWLIAPFRWLTPAWAGFLFGTFVLALQSLFLGQLSLYILEIIQRRLQYQYEEETTRRQRLALIAIAARDKKAYLAQNDLAQQAYGKSMALSVGRFCASLWPAVMALSWMGSRFSHAPFPLPLTLEGEPVSIPCAFIFVLFFTTARLLLSRLKSISSFFIPTPIGICPGPELSSHKDPV
jgi:hypothetical protein